MAKSWSDDSRYMDPGHVLLVYMVPVTVEVDVPNRRVRRVNVADDLVEPPTRIKSASAFVREAYAIAEAEEWPAWSIGS